MLVQLNIMTVLLFYVQLRYDTSLHVFYTKEI